MAFHPLKGSGDFQGIALVNFYEDGLDKVFVFNGFVVSGLPVITDPFAEPVRHAVNGITTVCDDGDGPMPWRYLECPYDCCQLGALVGLASTFQWLRDIPAGNKILYCQQAKVVDLGRNVVCRQ